MKNIIFFQVCSFMYSANIYWALTVYQDVLCLGNVGIQVFIEKSTFKDVMSADCSRTMFSGPCLLDLRDWTVSYNGKINDLLE